MEESCDFVIEAIKSSVNTTNNSFNNNFLNIVERRKNEINQMQNRWNKILEEIAFYQTYPNTYMLFPDSLTNHLFKMKAQIVAELLGLIFSLSTEACLITLYNK